MLARREGDKTYHAPRLAAEFANALLDNGTREDIDLAEKVLDAVLACQETHEADPHLGNFLWEREDEAIEDLNAVQFCLFQLIPLMIAHRNALSADLQNRVLQSIRLGLEEIRRIDVHLRYTNIAVKDITNTCLGGELLGDEAFKNRGYRKFQAWMTFTLQNGCAYEFNSPNYADVAMRVLHKLGELVQHGPTRMGAKTMRARIGLSAALHIHPPTGRWAGPFSRAYRQALFCQTPPEIDVFREYIATGLLPAWLDDALNHRPEAFFLRAKPPTRKTAWASPRTTAPLSRWASLLANCEVRPIASSRASPASLSRTTKPIQIKRASSILATYSTTTGSDRSARRLLGPTIRSSLKKASVTMFKTAPGPLFCIRPKTWAQ